MTKDEFNLLPSNGQAACPVCGNYSTHPSGGCNCPPSKTGYGISHINKNHHTCHINEWARTKILEKLKAELESVERKQHYAIINLGTEESKWFNKVRIRRANREVTELNAKMWQIRYDIDAITNLLKKV